MSMDKPLRIYTIQLAQWRVAKKANIELLDITVKSGDSTFSPSKPLLYGFKKGLISKEEYTKIYKEQMEVSREDNYQDWIDLLNREEVALACYCPKNTFCHRHLLVEDLTDLANELGLLVVVKGEITKDFNKLGNNSDEN